MLPTKTIKDPIYGYIEISEDLINIINTPYFQRLKDIIQTSYTAIYPSSLHNRFAHSLGVYWLGKLAFEAMLTNSPEIVKDISDATLNDVRQTFIMACLCHDLGHSPFSHTGEIFYSKSISGNLETKVDDPIFSEDIKAAGKGKAVMVGKEHENMSALLTLTVFKDRIKENFRSLFARCIIGLKYYAKPTQALDYLQAACIELLNSNVIDVDKLDYLIRDSYMSGYMNVKIDYERLLKGVYISRNENHALGFRKYSLSVLEAVLTAHDMERRWLQAHPAIQYEDYLLKVIIKEIQDRFDKKNKRLFSLKALTTEGVQLDNKEIRIRLLSDADILYLAKKNYNNSEAVREYFNRAARHHPIWKSEAEFKILFDFSHPSNKKFLEIIDSWSKKMIDGSYSACSLNPVFLKNLKRDRKMLQEVVASEKDVSKKNTLQANINSLDKEIKLLSELKSYFVSNGITFDLALVTQKQFKRNISKPEFKKLPIRFTMGDEVEKMMYEVVSLPSLDENKNDDFFYMYYKRISGEPKLNVNDFARNLRTFASEISE